MSIACAIYTRKSSEEGLEQDFNSLQAQREACEAFVLSQKSLGWTARREAYDDGGFSGGTMERPGLGRLLEDIRAGRIKVVVVYKVDRLTRSLADFAKIVELFDAHGVSFVSVTQHFNTTTSMGRLTLNVLLSFAQFEREVTGERIRDKIAASKRKGMWMGGVVPMGYRANGRTLSVDSEHAPLVTEIYRLYLTLGSVQALQRQLMALGRITPRRETQRRSQTGGVAFTRGHLYRILSNPVYIGQIRHKDQVYAGNHSAIIDLPTWEAVQRMLEANRQGAAHRPHAQHPSLLAGRVFDDEDRPLVPSHAQKGSRRYRYYILPARLQSDAQRTLRLPASELESAVVGALVEALRDEHRLMGMIGTIDAHETRRRLAQARALADELQQPTAEGIARVVDRAEVHPAHVRMVIDLGRLWTTDAIPHSIEIPAALKRCGMAVRLVVRPTGTTSRKPDHTLVKLLAKARDWADRLTTGQVTSVQAIAEAENVTGSYVTRVIQLGFLAPDVMIKLAKGEHAPDLNATRLLAMVPLPLDWVEQRRLMGFGS